MTILIFTKKKEESLLMRLDMYDIIKIVNKATYDTLRLKSIIIA